MSHRFVGCRCSDYMYVVQKAGNQRDYDSQIVIHTGTGTEQQNQNVNSRVFKFVLSNRYAKSAKINVARKLPVLQYLKESKDTFRRNFANITNSV